jgi:hypothetical protein
MGVILVKVKLTKGGPLYSEEIKMGKSRCPKG